MSINDLYVENFLQMRVNCKVNFYVVDIKISVN